MIVINTGMFRNKPILWLIIIILTLSGLESRPGESSILSTGTVSGFFSTRGVSLGCFPSSGWGG